MNTDKVEPLSAEQAKKLWRDSSYANNITIRESLEAICFGAHVVIDTATHSAVKRMTKAEARQRLRLRVGTSPRVAACGGGVASCMR